MLDLASGNANPIIIDFGYAREFHQSSKVFNKQGLNLNLLQQKAFIIFSLLNLIYFQ